LSSRRELIALSLKGLLAWAALSALGLYFGEWLGTALLPLIETTIRWFAPEYASTLTLVPQRPDALIQLSIRVLQPLQITASHAIPQGKELTMGTHLMHTLVPGVIELSILSVWPVRDWVQRLGLLLLGLVSALLVVAVTVPPLLLGLLEISLQEVAQQFNEARPEPFILHWMIFCETGGRWLLAIGVAWGCILLLHKLVINQALKYPVQRRPRQDAESRH